MPTRARIMVDEQEKESQTSIEVLRARQTANERAIISVHGEVRDMAATMATHGDVRAVTASVQALSAKIDNIGRPQWTAISVGITVMVVLGGLVYWPIRDKQSDQAELLHTVVNKLELTVPRIEALREWDRRDKTIEKIEDRLMRVERDNLVQSKR